MNTTMKALGVGVMGPLGGCTYSRTNVQGAYLQKEYAAEPKANNCGDYVICGMLLSGYSSAPRSRRNLTISVRPIRFEILKGVMPPWARALISAPLSSSNAAVSWWFLQHA